MFRRTGKNILAKCDNAPVEAGHTLRPLKGTHTMQNIHPFKAVAALVGIALTADWFMRREASLVHELLAALGNA
jgi:hypothetical protein